MSRKKMPPRTNRTRTTRRPVASGAEAVPQEVPAPAAAADTMPLADEGASVGVGLGKLLRRIPTAVNDYLWLESRDRWNLLALFVVAFALRAFSPIFPDFLTKPLSWPPISNCVASTPNGATTTGTVCGLAYPYQANAQPLQPCLPAGQVFDEVYFPCNAQDDFKGISYFDPEPPFAKTVIGWGEWIWGWYKATFQGAHGAYIDLGFDTVGFRLSSMFFGSLAVPLMYLFALRLWANRTFAFMAGFLTCFDGMFFAQSRIGMIDMVAIFFIILAYWAFQLHATSRTPRESYITLVAAGVAVGVAIASKWIALAALGTMVVFLVARALKSYLNLEASTPFGWWKWRDDRGEEPPPTPGGAPGYYYIPLALVSFIVIPIVIYIASWAPFFTRHQFMNLNDLWQYQVETYQYHANLRATHPYGSAWFSWPFLWRPVAYYFESGSLGVDQGSTFLGFLNAHRGESLAAGMTDLGNPLIWWISIPCVLSLPYFIFKHRSYAAAIILVGFLTQWLPWERITRVIFLYHMFAGLIFMVLAVAFVSAHLASSSFSFRIGSLRAAVAGSDLLYAYVGFVLVAFAYFYPLWTALPISNSSYFGSSNDPVAHQPHLDGKMWLNTWI